VILGWMSSSLGLCCKAVDWLFGLRNNCRDQVALDNWACERLMSSDLVKELSGSDRRGAPTINDIPTATEEEQKNMKVFVQICDSLLFDAPIVAPTQSLRQLVQYGIVVQCPGREYRFSSMFSKNLYARQRFCPQQAPVELQGPNPDIHIFVKMVIVGMCADNINQSLTRGKDGRPLEILYQKEMERSAFGLIPISTNIHCQFGGDSGRKTLDLYINGPYRFALELLRDDNDLKEHCNRFEKPSAHQPDSTVGNYYHLVSSGQVKQWAVIQLFVGVMPKRAYTSAHAYRVCFDGDFFAASIEYPDLKTEKVKLLGNVKLFE